MFNIWCLGDIMWFLLVHFASNNLYEGREKLSITATDYYLLFVLTDFIFWIFGDCFFVYFESLFSAYWIFSADDISVHDPGICYFYILVFSCRTGSPFFHLYRCVWFSVLHYSVYHDLMVVEVHEVTKIYFIIFMFKISALIPGIFICYE
jgi:hypothetical protein